MATKKPEIVIEKPKYLDDIGIPDVVYNPLQRYRNVTYHTRLTMMPQSEVSKGRPARSFDFKKGMVMWETGATGTVYLEELVMNVVGSGSATGLYAFQTGTKWTGKLVEPIGGRFLESIHGAAQLMGYPKPDSAEYLLEITFKGYNVGSDEPEVCLGWDNEELVFRWYVQLRELSMKLDYKGSTYDFIMAAASTDAQLSDHTHIETGLSVARQTKSIEDFCNALSKILNEREDEKVKTGQRCFSHIYHIIPHKDIAKLKLVNEGLIPTVSSFFRGDYSGKPGETIQNFILKSLANSDALMAYMHKIPEKKFMNDVDTKLDTIHILPRNVSIISGTKVREQNGAIMFDNKIGTSAKEVYYFITTKPDAKNIIGAKEYESAWNATNRNKRVDEFIKLGVLRKAYKWIYTGENSEVINCELKFDYLWRMVRPQFVNENGKAVGTVPSVPGQSSSSRAGPPSVSCNEARKVNVPASEHFQLYAEDFLYREKKENLLDYTEPRPGWYPHMPQIHITNIDAVPPIKNKDNAREYSIYTQINNQQGQGTADLRNLTLEVVGDPYYLMQIPGTPSKPPYEEDVWEYMEKNLTEEDMAKTRGKTASHSWLPFIYFQANIPAADTDANDVMNLRQADAITGIYVAREMQNKFIKGKFTSTLTCTKEHLSNPSRLSEKAKREISQRTGIPIDKLGEVKPVGQGSAAASGPNKANRPGRSRRSFPGPLG